MGLKPHLKLSLTLFGFIVGPHKAQFHLRVQKQSDFAAMLVDLNQMIKPVLYIVDGIIGMEGNGPRNGQPIKAGVLIAGTNGFAVDLIMSRIMGFNAERLPVAARALSLKLVPELAAIEVGGSAQDIIVPFAAPKNLESLEGRIPHWVARFGQNQLTAQAVITGKCVGCGRCAAHCPPQAITVQDGRAEIKQADCIRCYCCQELCPHDALHLVDGLLLRMVKLLFR